MELTQSQQSCAAAAAGAGSGMLCVPGNKSNLDDVYGATDDDESSTICCLQLPRLSPRCSLRAIRSVATRFAWMHSLLACGLEGKLIEIFHKAFFFSS